MPSKRSHSKSRLGCKQCKRRRIRCDQTPRSCANCIKKGLECDYLEWEEAFTSNIRIFTPETILRKSPPKPPPMELDKASVTSSSNSTASSFHPASLSPPPPSLDAPPPPFIFSLDDLGLLHHFTLHSSQTLSAIDSDQHHRIWQHDVPRLAQSHPFLMHALLSFGAAHRAKSTGEILKQQQQQQQQQQQHEQHEQQLLPQSQFQELASPSPPPPGSSYDAAARYHYSKALALFRESVDELTADKAGATYCYCTLICFLTLHLDAEKPAEQRDPIGDILNFLSLSHTSLGVLRAIHEPLMSSISGRLLSHTLNQERDTHPISPDVHHSLQQLDVLAQQYAESMFGDFNHFAVLQLAIIELRRLFTLSHARPTSWAHILGWAIKMPPDFRPLLQERNPVALCILAHWCVPVYNAPPKWFASGWPGQLLLDICRRLQDTEWSKGIEWPISQTLGMGRFCPNNPDPMGADDIDDILPYNMMPILI